MHDAFDFVMTEHAAWQQADGCVQRVFALDAGRWLATLQDGRLTLDHLSGSGPEPARDVFTLSKGLSTVPELTAALRGLGSVLRFRNADLWDAIGTSIIRQVIRAGQSKKLYRAFVKRMVSRLISRTAPRMRCSRHQRLCSG